MPLPATTRPNCSSKYSRSVPTPRPEELSVSLLYNVVTPVLNSGSSDTWRITSCTTWTYRWSCHMATAWMAKDWPRSTCTHCVPFLNSTASSSTASFLPSVIRLSSPKYGGTLLVTGLPAATFVTPLGTWMDGGATSERGSTFGPAGKSSGVPLSVWRGRSSFSGSVALASSARTGDPKQAAVNATTNRGLNRSGRDGKRRRHCEAFL